MFMACTNTIVILGTNSLHNFSYFSQAFIYNSKSLAWWIVSCSEAFFFFFHGRLGRAVEGVELSKSPFSVSGLTMLMRLKWLWLTCILKLPLWTIDRLTDWQTDRLTDWQTDKLTDWQTDRLRRESKHKGLVKGGNTPTWTPQGGYIPPEL